MTLCATIEKPNILLISEVIPKAQKLPITVQCLALPGYRNPILNFNPEGLDLGSSGTRGLAIYVDDSLSISPVKMKSVFNEYLVIEVTLTGTDKLLIALIYRNRQDITDHDSCEALCNLFNELDARNASHMIIAGDCNMKNIDWENNVCHEGPNHVSQHFLSCVQECFMYQHIVEPTRFRAGDVPSILDLVFSNEEAMVHNVTYLSPLGHSDHSCLVFDVKVKTSSPTSSENHLILHRGDYNGMRFMLEQVDWNLVFHSNQVESCWKGITTEVCKAVMQCIPMKSSKPSKTIFIDLETKRLRRKKNKAYVAYIGSRNNDTHARYVILRNKLRKKTRQVRRDHETKLAQDFKEKPKLMWRYINSRLKTRSCIEDLNRTDGTAARTNLEKAEELRLQFDSVFTKENISFLPAMPDCSAGHAITDVEVTVFDVCKRLKELNVYKSPGPDGIHPRILSECAEQLSEPLTALFKLSMDAGVLPIDWKKGNISAIFKQGSRHEAANYRPVSLTCIACKIMESIVRDVIMQHLLANKLLSDHQHGFVPGRSCSTQLLKVIDEWTEALDKGKSLDVIYLDFAKAFDSVPHKRLILKMSAYGVRGKLLNWIENFLTDRWQRVTVMGESSEWSRVSSGVPQGSVLGPLLFLVYINDLPEMVRSSAKVFADDTKLYRTVSAGPDAQELQNDLDSLHVWSQNWQLPFNANKCKVMHLGKGSIDKEYSIDGEVLQTVDMEKDLGVIIDKKLKFHQHAAQAVAKGFRMLGMIKRSFVNLNRQTIPLLFNSIVRPILEYGNCVWGPVFCGDQDQIERVLRRATRLDPSLREQPYEQRLQQLNMPSMFFRRQRGDMIMVFQIMTGRLPILEGQLFERAEGRQGNRGHHLKLRKPPVNTVTRQHCFAIRVINEWNQLPEQVVSAPSLNAFKNRLDVHWNHRKFKTRHE